MIDGQLAKGLLGLNTRQITVLSGPLINMWEDTGQRMDARLYMGMQCQKKGANADSNYQTSAP